MRLPNAHDWLEGLDEYSHVHLIFHFHLNDVTARARPRVRPPLLDGAKTGVFSTRAPYRPNALGWERHARTIGRHASVAHTLRAG